MGPEGCRAAAHRTAKDTAAGTAAMNTVAAGTAASRRAAAQDTAEREFRKSKRMRAGMARFLAYMSAAVLQKLEQIRAESLAVADRLHCSCLFLQAKCKTSCCTKVGLLKDRLVYGRSVHADDDREIQQDAVASGDVYVHPVNATASVVVQRLLLFTMPAHLQWRCRSAAQRNYGQLPLAALLLRTWQIRDHTSVFFSVIASMHSLSPCHACMHNCGVHEDP